MNVFFHSYPRLTVDQLRFSKLSMTQTRSSKHCPVGAAANGQGMSVGMYDSREGEKSADVSPRVRVEGVKGENFGGINRGKRERERE